MILDNLKIYAVANNYLVHFFDVDECEVIVNRMYSYACKYDNLFGGNLFGFFSFRFLFSKFVELVTVKSGLSFVFSLFFKK